MLLGLNDTEFEGTFRWADHTPVQYTNFIAGEPAGDFPDEDFVGMVVQTGFGVAGQWHDIISDFRFNDVTFGVVEVAPVPLPFPAALLATAIGGLAAFRRHNK